MTAHRCGREDALDQAQRRAVGYIPRDDGAGGEDEEIAVFLVRMVGYGGGWGRIDGRLDVDYLRVEARGEGIEYETVGFDETCGGGDGVLLRGAVGRDFLC